jgi:hypothetical protein
MKLQTYKNWLLMNYAANRVEQKELKVLSPLIFI